MASLALAFASASVGAQAIGARVKAVGDGAAQLRYRARPGVCGDGDSYYRTRDGGGRYVGRGLDRDRDCEPGPVRLVVTVSGGRVTRLRTYVGPDRATGPATDLGRVSTADAAAFLEALAEGDDGSVGGQAIEALVLADSVTAWPTLLRLARDSTRSRRVRQPATFWLGQEAAERLGLGDVDSDRTDDDDVRAQAVFALSQQPRDRAVPQLLTIAREGRNKVARRQALFWLGQTGDPRAVELFAQVMGAK